MRLTFGSFFQERVKAGGTKDVPVCVCMCTTRAVRDFSLGAGFPLFCLSVCFHLDLQRGLEHLYMCSTEVQLAAVQDTLLSVAMDLEFCWVSVEGCATQAPFAVTCLWQGLAVGPKQPMSYAPCYRTLFQHVKGQAMILSCQHLPGHPGNPRALWDVIF